MSRFCRPISLFADVPQIIAEVLPQEPEKAVPAILNDVGDLVDDKIARQSNPSAGPFKQRRSDKDQGPDRDPLNPQRRRDDTRDSPGRDVGFGQFEPRIAQILAKKSFDQLMGC